MRPALLCVLIATLLLAGCARNSEPVSVADAATQPTPTTADASTIRDGTDCTYTFLPQDAVAAETPAPTEEAGGGAPTTNDPAYQERISELFAAAENGEISRVLKALEKGLNI